MPTQRAHGGAALVPINLVAPGFAGLNTEQEASILGTEWATSLNNAVFDATGRVAVRKGWLSVTTTPGAAEIERVWEFRKADGTTGIVSTTASDIYNTASAPTSIKGALTLANAHIAFGNFNDKMVAFNEGLAVWTGTGNFAAVTAASGTAPNGSIGTCAAGRVWGVDTDGKTIRYSALLDETRWAEADGGGSIDMGQVWPNGQDEVIAIKEFNGDIVVFGSNHIVFWTDGAGASLGIDPDQMYVSDALQGIGAISQHAMCHVAGSLWFLTSNGVVALERDIVQKSNPLRNVSKHIQNFVKNLRVAETDANAITMSYSPKEDMVIMTFPASGRSVVFDARQKIDDAAYRSATWTCGVKGLTYLRDGSWYGSLTGTTGKIFNYTGYDDNGASYSLTYESGWMDMGPDVGQYKKILKRLTSLQQVEADTAVTYSWEFDFGLDRYSTVVTLEGSSPAEYNVGEFNIAEFSGSLALRLTPVAAKGTGQYIKVGIEVDTNNAAFSIQQLTLFAKIGRIA